MCDVFAAGEPPIPGADSANLCAAIKDHGHKDVTHVPRRADVARQLAGELRGGEIVIALGAGEQATRDGVAAPSHVAAMSTEPTTIR